MAAARDQIPLNIPALPKLKGTKPKRDEGLFDLIDKLNDGGFHSGAGQVMDLAMNLNPEWEKKHEEFVTLKYIESQNYRKALDMAAQHFDSSVYGPVAPQSDPMFAAFFPLAFSDVVTRGYRRTGLPRGAIEGIMREESLFQVNVRSSAGAMGLMQVMPRTGAIMARKDSGNSGASDLTQPRDNVLLGSYYLADMLKLFGGQMPLAIMAYNAGPGNVNKFLRKLGNLDLDEFIENIPISETRAYVKRVMRSMKVYGSIYDEAEFKDPFFSLQVNPKVR
jgi:soluble lytic murein transglycosylase